MSPNSPELVETLLAASVIGACVVPLNTRLIGSEIAYQCDDADVAYAVVHPTVSNLGDKGGLLTRRHVHIGEDLEERIRAADLFQGPRPDPDAPLIQLYTSGTTGKPKGCLLTQQNWVARTTSYAGATSIVPADVVLTSLSLFHVAGLGWAAVQAAPVVRDGGSCRAK